MSQPPALLREEATEIDRRAQEEYGIPSIVLMENAGIRAAGEILRLLAQTRDAGSRRVDVVAGNGNNGGDGFVVARQLHNEAVDVRVVLTGARERILARGGDAATNLTIVERMGIPWEEAPPDELLEREDLGLRPGSLVVDAILGTGLTRDLEGSLRQWVARLAEHSGIVVALDLPTGLDCNTGRVLGAAVRAHTTVTFVAPKKGFYLEEGPRCCGRIVVASIGAPRELVS